MSSTWYLTDIAADINDGFHFNNTLINTNYSCNIQILHVGTGEGLSYGFTNPGFPDNDHWESGNITVETTVSSASRGINMRLNIMRVDQSGIILQESAYSETRLVEATGIWVFNIPSTTWGLGNNTDRLRLNFYSSGTHSKQDSFITLDQVKIIAPIVISPSSQPPKITIVNYSRDKISSNDGFQSSYIEFQSDQVLTQWEARSNGNERGVGVLVGLGDSLQLNSSGFFEVYYDELTAGDKDYRITVYGQNTEGAWSGYD